MRSKRRQRSIACCTLSRDIERRTISRTDCFEPEWRAARDQQHVEAARRQGARQDCGAADMADAQQVLHMKEDAAHDSGAFGWSSVTLPSPCAVKKCRHFQSSLTGWRP